MKINEPSPEAQQDQNQDFESVLKDLQKIKEDYIGGNLKWFGGRRPWVILVYRLSGVLIIGLSLITPFLVMLGGYWKDFVLPACTFLIALMASLNSFFQWQATWQKYSRIQLTLEYLESVWKVDMLRAKQQADKLKGLGMAIRATRRMLDTASSTINTEAQRYFERLRLPQETESNKNSSPNSDAAQQVIRADRE